ncbi:hypothetical protein OK348_06345 [Flavobacterium sp. MXW15]|uniref:Uncharacterized protein n=1 Tax=Xanthomonas chitinilytica TaxID=2989819 RepID=A0ABT3JYT0_9XANT|nr:hypothetical protein [Xanthomonas sp. H13-6]MCW4454412.1 hypothetical protein [Flavobacterium sp. MXW15]MCW4473374.1 hypothetical protein [Xanthomonas sp. H13-6]
MKTLPFALCTLSLAWAGSSTAEARDPTPIGKVTDIVVTEDGQGPAADDCASFRVTPAQVASFLRRAIVITPRQEHDWFLYGPCYARGTLDTRYGPWQWEMRSLGTATLVSVTGDAFVLGDPRQESSLATDD